MVRYYTYEGKRVGFVRKAIDEVILIEDGWVSSLNHYFAKEGYDELLGIVAKIMQHAGQPNISRAQAWVMLAEVTNKGVPEALRQVEIDEQAGKGTLIADIAKAPVRAVATVIDTTSAGIGAVVGATTSATTSAAETIEEIAEDVLDGDEDGAE